MTDVFPLKLKFDNSNRDDKLFFTMQAKCRNCGNDYSWILVPKGKVISEYEKTLKCTRCEVVGLISVWP